MSTCCDRCREARTIPCPTCEAKAGESCMSELVPGLLEETSMTHLSRRLAYSKSS